MRDITFNGPTGNRPSYAYSKVLRTVNFLRASKTGVAYSPVTFVVGRGQGKDITRDDFGCFQDVGVYEDSPGGTRERLLGFGKTHYERPHGDRHLDAGHLQYVKTSGQSSRVQLA